MATDIEYQNLSKLGDISRPFSNQLGARAWYFDPVREFIQSKVQKIQAVDYPVIGVDVSAWQETIDWAKLSSKIYFAFVRAGRGNSDLDAYCQANIAGAHKYGRALGLYWYMIPRTGSNWQQHIISFKSVYKDSGSQLPPVFDVEDNGGLSKTALTAWIQKAVAGFEDAVGISPIIYTSAGFWNGNTYRNDWAKDLLLWVAHWTTASSPLLPNDWAAIHNPETWEFWQHAVLPDGREHGVSSTNLDHDRYKWSLATFNSTYKMNLLPLDDTPIPPPPPPVPSDEIHPLYKVEVLPTATPFLNIRSGKGVEFTAIGSTVYKDVLPVIIEDGDWLKIEGYINKNYVKKL